MPITKENAKELGRLGGLTRKGKVDNNTVAVRQAKTWFVNEILKDRQAWYRALRDAGLGHFVGTQLPTGEMVDVYTKSPNVEAIKEVLSRAFGKVPQTIEIESDQPFAINNYALALIQPFLDPNDPEDAAFVLREDALEDGEPGDEEGMDQIVPALEEADALIRAVLLPPHHQDGAAADPPRAPAVPVGT